MDRVNVSTFLDHRGQCALSITCPMILESNNGAHRSTLGTLRRIPNYPCFQVYHADHRLSLDEPGNQQDAIRRIRTILFDLDKKGFSTLFDGIRFEVYGGRPEFHQRLTTGERNQGCIQAMKEHAIEEHEHRNTLGMLRAAMVTYNKCSQIWRRAIKGKTSHDEVSAARRLLHETFDKMRYLGSLISPDIARLYVWQNNFHCAKPVQQSRRKSISDTHYACIPFTFNANRANSNQLASGSRNGHITKPGLHIRQRSNSTGGLTKPIYIAVSTEPSTGAQLPTPKVSNYTIGELPTLTRYLVCRLKRLLDPLLYRMHVSITPNSFYSHPEHPWHSSVLVMSRDNTGERDWHVMRFGKVPSLEQITDANFSFFDPDQVKLQRVSVGPSNDHQGQGREQLQNVADVLMKQLHLLGYVKPSIAPHTDPARVVAEVETWFGPSEVGKDESEIMTVEMVGQEFENFLNGGSPEDDDSDLSFGSEADSLWTIEDNKAKVNAKYDTQEIQVVEDDEDADMLM